ncbi:Uncharacterised protein [Achromobacter ruhlandii]|nr:Uncharacterised protein [Achromobacter ruhlandii]
MVLGHHDVELAAAGPHEDCVAGPRTAGVDALVACLTDGRRDDVEVLAAELAAFAGVRVQAGHRHARPGDPHLAAGAVGQAHGGQFGFGRDARHDVRQRDVNGHQQHAQFVVGEHHGEVVGARAFRQDLGVAGVVDAGLVHRLLVQRRRDDGADAAGLGVVDGGADVVVGGASGGRADLAVGQVGRQGGTTGHHLDAASIAAGLADVGDLADLQARAQRGRGAPQRARIAIHHARGIQALGAGLDDDFGANAGGIPHGDAHGRRGVHDRFPVYCLVFFGGSISPHSNVTVARLEPRPVAWLEVTAGFCSLRPIDWQY